MTGFVTPAQARETLPCPLAKTFAEKIGPNCDAGKCPVWRWLPLMASEPGYLEALRAAEGTTPPGEKKALTGISAPRWVNANRAACGLPDKPWRGWCGLGGKPEA